MNRNLLTALLTFVTISASAQFYIKGGLGYSFPQAGQTLDGSGNPYVGEINYTQSSSFSQHSDFKIKKASFSAGGSLVLGAGYMFSKNLGVELNAELGLMSKTNTTKIAETYPSPEFYNIEVTQHAKMPVILSPSLVLQSGGDKLNIYMRGGFALPVASKIIMEETDTYNDGSGSGTETDKYTAEVNSKFNVGFSGAAGLKYMLSKHLSLWGECSLLSLSMYVKEQKLTKLEVNGVDKLYLVNPDDRVIDFKSEDNTDDPANSTTKPTYALPFSHFGINAGVTFTL